MQTYKYKTILVTGASSGIGEAMVRQLYDPTTTLLLTARSEDALNQLADEARRAGGQAAVFPHDLGEPGSARMLHERITHEGYMPDVLINNAGFGKQGRFEAFEAETYESMIGLNVTNLVSLTRLCLPAMLKHGDAGILNVASTAGYQSLPYFAIYGATKSFVKSFSEALYGEYRGRGVTVSCLCPGPTRTQFQDRAGTNAAFSKSPESAEKVARVGLQMLLNDEMTTISGAVNKIGAVLGKLAPSRIVVPALRQALKPERDAS